MKAIMIHKRDRDDDEIEDFLSFIKKIIESSNAYLFRPLKREMESIFPVLKAYNMFRDQDLK